MKRAKLFLVMFCLILLPLCGLAEDRLHHCDVNELKQALKAWKAPALTREVNDQGVVYYAQWEGKRPLSDYGVRIVADEQGAVKYFTFTCVFGDPQDFALCLEAFPEDAEEDRAQAMQWIAQNLGESLSEPTVVKTYGDVTLSLIPIGMLTVRPADEEEMAAAATHEVQKMSFDHKPGIVGSNAYDLTIGAEDNGLTVGKRQATNDGYTWYITGTTYYGSYTISIETNKQYEIHRAMFSHAGNDATFFPWAVTLPFDAADIEGASAWVKACQKADKADSYTVGDAVWTFKPHENGRQGGVLTLAVDSFEAYSLYLIDQLD